MVSSRGCRKLTDTCRFPASQDFLAILVRDLAFNAQRLVLRLKLMGSSGERQLLVQPFQPLTDAGVGEPEHGIRRNSAELRGFEIPDRRSVAFELPLVLPLQVKNDRADRVEQGPECRAVLVDALADGHRLIPCGL